MAVLLLLITLTLALHQLLLHLPGPGLMAVLQGGWVPWALLLLGLWLFSGTDRDP